MPALRPRNKGGSAQQSTKTIVNSTPKTGEGKEVVSTDTTAPNTMNNTVASSCSPRNNGIHFQVQDNISPIAKDKIPALANTPVLCPNPLPSQNQNQNQNQNLGEERWARCGTLDSLPTTVTFGFEENGKGKGNGNGNGEKRGAGDGDVVMGDEHDSEIVGEDEEGGQDLELGDDEDHARTEFDSGEEIDWEGGNGGSVALSVGEENQRESEIRQQDDEMELDFPPQQHAESLIRYQCPFLTCRHQSKNDTYLATHIETRHPHNSTYIACPRCTKQYSTIDSLVAHLNIRHVTHEHKYKTNLPHLPSLFRPATPARRCECILCLKIFPSKMAVTEHMDREHKDEDPKPYKCDICGVGCLRKRNLREHYDCNHGAFANCPHCGEALQGKYRMNKHIRENHTQVNQFPCLYCDKGFSTISVRAYHHERFHEEERLFVCGEEGCGMKFDCEAMKKGHENVVHRGVENGYVCEKCRKRYTAWGHLGKHMLERHPGFRIYPERIVAAEEVEVIGGDVMMGGRGEEMRSASKTADSHPENPSAQVIATASRPAINQTAIHLSQALHDKPFLTTPTPSTKPQELPSLTRDANSIPPKMPAIQLLQQAPISSAPAGSSKPQSLILDTKPAPPKNQQPYSFSSALTENPKLRSGPGKPSISNTKLPSSRIFTGVSKPHVERPLSSAQKIAQAQFLLNETEIDDKKPPSQAIPPLSEGQYLHNRNEAIIDLTMEDDKPIPLPLQARARTPYPTQGFSVAQRNVNTPKKLFIVLTGTYSQALPISSTMKIACHICGEEFGYRDQRGIATHYRDSHGMMMQLLGSRRN